MAKEGILRNGSVSDLPLGKPVDYETVASKSREGVNFASWLEYPDEYRAVVQLEEGDLSIAVQPSENEAYAFYQRGKTRDETYIAKADYGIENVETSDETCYKDCNCVSKCGNYSRADESCCVYYPCSTDTTCSRNIWCDCCPSCV